jgi:transcription elongation factor GreA
VLNYFTLKEDCTFMQRVPMTPEGYQKLQENLEKLLKVDRPGIIKAIAEARSHGDLSENAEYHAAKERQSFIEGRIQELQAKLALAQVIDPSKINQSMVAFGAKVKVLDTDTNEENVFTLVGPDEADVKNSRISINSPVGRSLLGKKVGDSVVIKAPAKTMEYEILEINFE